MVHLYFTPSDILVCYELRKLIIYILYELKKRHKADHLIHALVLYMWLMEARNPRGWRLAYNT